jgi:hypothetical protein
MSAGAGYFDFQNVVRKEARLASGYCVSLTRRRCSQTHGGHGLWPSCQRCLGPFRIAALTFSITRTKSSWLKPVSSRWNALYSRIFSALSASDRASWAGAASMEILVVSGPHGVLLETIRVGNRVHNLLPTGNGTSTRLCRREDLPADWSPTITS